MRIRYFILVAFVFGTIVFSLPAAGGDFPAELTALWTEAFEKSPEIAAARAEWDAARARVPQAGAWEDPKAGVGFMNIPVDNPSLNRTGMTGIEYSLKQQVPVGGKKWTAKKSARFEAAAAREEYNDALAYVFWQVADPFFSLYETEQSLYLLNRSAAIADELVRVAQKRFASGLVPQQDVLKAQVEYGNILDRILTVEKRRKTLKARINEVAGREMEAPVTVPRHLRRVPLPMEPDAFRVRAEEASFRVKARSQKVESARAMHRLSKLKLIPDPEFGFAYRQRFVSPGDPVMGEDFFSASVSVPLPLWLPRKQAKAVAESRAKLEAARARLRDTRQNILYEVEDTLAELTRASREANLVESALLPQSRASFENAKAAYQGGKVDFLNVLNDFLSSLHFEIRAVAASADYERARAKLFYLVGEDFAEGGFYAK